MADRQQGYGFTAEVSEKIAGKYDSNQGNSNAVFIKLFFRDV